MVVIALGVLTVSATAATPAPLPAEIVGTWTDQSICGPKARKMVFAAKTITVIQDDGRKKLVQIDTAGELEDGLEVRVTKVLSGEAEDPAGAHVGDVIVMRREVDKLRFIGHADAGQPIRQDSNGPVLHRCKS
jgi:hypothetical protein